MESLQKQLIAACRELREPAGYYHGITGGRQDMPDNIILLHRCREMKISFAHNADKLYHSRYVLTLNLKAEGLVCVNEKSFPLPEGYAALTYPYQSHCYVVDQNVFDWLIVTFEQNCPLAPGLMYRQHPGSAHRAAPSRNGCWRSTGSCSPRPPPQGRSCCSHCCRHCFSSCFIRPISSMRKTGRTATTTASTSLNSSTAISSSTFPIRSCRWRNWPRNTTSLRRCCI